VTTIGITGSLASGKTTAAKYLKEFGARLINADSVAHDLYKNDRDVVKAVRKEFGKEVFSGKMIDRKKLGGVVFKNKNRMNRLCAIVHPRIMDKIKKEARKEKKRIVVIDAPLLLEAGLHKFVDYVLVVKAGRNAIMRRCGKKGLGKKEAGLVLKTQMPTREKIKYADFAVANNGTKSDLRKKIKRIWKKVSGR